MKTAQESEDELEPGQEILPTDQDENQEKVEAPLPSKKPVIVQFVGKGNEVIKDIGRRRKQGKKK